MTRTAQFKYTSDLQKHCSREHFGDAEDEGWSDLSLVRRCAQRDPAAMREIVHRYEQKLYRFQYRMIGSHEDTEDAVMDVFVRVWQQANKFESRSAFATWLYRIATNVACDLMRSRKGQCQTTSMTSLEFWPSAWVADAEKSALNNMEREERAAQLQQALQQLSVGDRLILILYYTEDMGYEEIGEITRLPYSVLKMRLMRARKRLRVLMDSLATEAQE